MHAIGLRRWTLAAILALSCGIAGAAPESRVATEEIDQWNRSQVEAALKSVLAKENCQTDSEKTYNGSGVLEIKCSIDAEKITAQIKSETLSGSGAEDKTQRKNFTSVWIKTTSGKKIWSRIIDQEMIETLRESAKPAAQD